MFALQINGVDSTPPAASSNLSFDSAVAANSSEVGTVAAIESTANFFNTVTTVVTLPLATNSLSIVRVPGSNEATAFLEQVTINNYVPVLGYITVIQLEAL